MTAPEMTELAQLAQIHWDQLEASKQRRQELKRLALKLHYEGVSEYQLAAEAGTTRKTIRAWLGK